MWVQLQPPRGINELRALLQHACRRADGVGAEKRPSGRADGARHGFRPAAGRGLFRGGAEKDAQTTAGLTKPPGLHTLAGLARSLLRSGGARGGHPAHVNARIAAARLHNQRLAGRKGRGAADVVAWLGAVQAQESGPSRWALALRLRGAPGDAAIARAFDRGRILRTHVLRPTWHFVTPADIRWMLALTAPRVHQRMAPYDRHLELDRPLLTRAAAVIERALGEARVLTRQELRAALARAGIDARSQRLAHIVLYAELEQIVCSGPRRGSQFTYALLADRAPRARTLPREEALATLARRYLRSHGPATVRDFVWWSGLTTADARRAFEMNRARGESDGGLTYWSLPGSPDPGEAPLVQLLPIYDEYLIAYQDRVAVPHGPLVLRSMAGPATFQHALVAGGQVAGTWRAADGRGGVGVEIVPLRTLTRAERSALEAAVAAYERFRGLAVTVRIRSRTR